MFKEVQLTVFLFFRLRPSFLNEPPYPHNILFKRVRRAFDPYIYGGDLVPVLPAAHLGVRGSISVALGTISYTATDR